MFLERHFVAVIGVRFVAVDGLRAIRIVELCLLCDYGRMDGMRRGDATRSPMLLVGHSATLAALSLFKSFLFSLLGLLSETDFVEDARYDTKGNNTSILAA